MNATQIALSRADEAEKVSAAYAVQVRKREMELADCPCLEHYKNVAEAKAHLGSAKRHATDAVRATKNSHKPMTSGVPYGTLDQRMTESVPYGTSDTKTKEAAQHG